MQQSCDTIIAGAGITGLTTGYELKKINPKTFVLFDGNKPGGALSTVHQEGWTLEKGPNTIVLTNTYLTKLISELGLEPEMLTADRIAGNRFIVRNKKLIALPGSPGAFLKTPLFSARAKLRLFAEPFIKKGTDPDESLADFVRRRLGEEFLTYAINPFVAGVYAGNPENLSARMAFPMLKVLEEKYGSLIKGQFKIKPEDRKPGDLPRAKAPMVTFRQGNQSLTNRLAEKLGSSMKPGSRITHITKKEKTSGEISYSIETETGDSFITNSLILTLPLHVLKGIRWTGFGDLSPDKMLPQVIYPPLSVVHLGFRREDVAHPLDGFGMLIPAAEKMQILGCLFNSSLFPGRTPDDSNFVLLTCFIGGSRNPSFAMEEDDVVYRRVLEDTGTLLGTKGEPVLKRITRWPKAIPQYSTAYQQVYDALAEMEKAHRGLHFLGNFRDGIAVPDCVRNAVRFAEGLNASP